MYPTLPIGNNVNFKAWPFACRISVRTLMCLLLDIIAALEADGVRKIVLVNGHGGNTATLEATLREHVDITPPDRRAFVCQLDGPASPQARAAIVHPSNHGGESEVSRMLYLHPDLVRTAQFQNQPFGTPQIPSLEKSGAYYVRPWHRHVPLSAGGDTRQSTADKGRDLIESTADNLAQLLLELSATPWHPDFPYPPPA